MLKVFGQTILVLNALVVLSGCAAKHVNDPATLSEYSQRQCQELKLSRQKCLEWQLNQQKNAQTPAVERPAPVFYLPPMR